MRFALSTYLSKNLFRSSLAGGALLASAALGCSSQPAPSQTAASSNPVIVRLISRQEVITITAGPNAPLYTVADGSGRVLVSEMSMPEMKKSRPDLYQQISPAVAPSAEAWAGE